MYKVSDFTKKAYRMGEVAQFLGITVRHLRNYDYDHRIKTIRSAGNHRLVLREDLIEFLDSKGLIYNDIEDSKRDVIYARVSSYDQKNHGDLDRQALFLIENNPNLRNPLIIKEVGSGLNDKRDGIQKLIQLAAKDEIRNVYITYKDRLTRFGFHYLETMFKAHGVNIIVVKDIKDKKSVEEELVEDMMSLIASFSGKLYGMRSKKRNAMKKMDERFLEMCSGKEEPDFSSLIIEDSEKMKQRMENARMLSLELFEQSEYHIRNIEVEE